VRALLRRAALTLAALPVVLVAIVLLLLSLGITVRLDPLRPTFEAAVSSALGREVALEGSMVLVPTFSPTVEVQGLRIANPPDWPTPDFARMELARLQIGVLPLLWERRLQVREFTAEGVSLLLHRAAGGEANWDFAGLESPAEPAEPEEPEKAEAPPDPEEIRERLLTAAELEELRLRDIEVHYRDDTSGEDVVFTLNELFAEVATDLPSKLSMQGAFRAHPFSVSLTTGNPMDLLTGDEAWPLELTLEIAGTTLQLSGQLDEGPLPDLGASGEPPPAEAAPEAGRRFGELSLSLRGERLSSLDELVGVALPPLGPYSFEGHFRAFAGKRYEAEVVIGVGTSRLEGTMKLAAVQQPPRVEIDLATETVQLDDFDAGDWSPFGEAAAGAPAAEQPSDRSEPLRARALLSPEVMQRVNARLSVRVGEVRFGADRLGSAQLVAKLEKGRFSLDPLELSVPGGSLRSTAALHPTAKRVSGEVTARVDRFDYGILARRADPETEMRGLLALDLALRSSAPSVETFMEHAGGHVDFAIFPEEFEAGIIDLWAVNLISAVLPVLESGDPSKINCVVGLFDMNDGLMEQRSILVDTSRMSVTGTAKVDFRTERVKVELAPSPKKPEFFNLATPIQVDGTFSDFGVGVKPEDLLGTAIRFVTSIVHVPLQRIFLGVRPAEDIEGCLAAMKRPEK